MKLLFILLTYFCVYTPVLILFAFMPYLTRKDESFGVSIPENVYYYDELKTLRKSYRNIILLIDFILLFVFLIFDLKTDYSPPIFASYGILSIIGVSFFLYIIYHNKMKVLKKGAQWVENTSEKVLVNTAFRKKLKLPSPLLFLIHVGIIITTLIIGIYYYDKMPSQVPMNYNFNGEITNQAEKSYKLLFFAPVTQTFMTLIMVFVYWVIKRSKQQINIGNPQKSMEQDIIFRVKWSNFVIIISILLLLLFAFMQLSFLGIVTNPYIIMIVPFVLTLFIIVYALYLSIKIGQGGSRIKTKKDGTVNVNSDDDKYWKLGVFYFNPKDPAIFIQKRFGIGWTNNFAHPLSWIMIVGLIVLIILITKTTSFLTS